MGSVLLPNLGQPDQGRHQGRQDPEAQADLPTVAKGVAQWHRGTGRHGGAQAQRHGVDTGHGAGLAGEIALDDTRQQHADDANAGTCNQATEEQPHLTERTAQDDPRGQGQQDAEHHALGAETPGQHRRGRCKQAQAQHRQGGQ